tara:strand:- start:8656 stop:9153 length:498 start_codon:yes stop_codon:yes gene_type:complete
MCDIGTAISVGAGIIEKQAEISENNARSARTRKSAIGSLNAESDAEQQKFADDNTAAVQEAYELHLTNAFDRSVAMNQAADSGVYGTSVNEGLFATINKGAREDNRFYQELRSRQSQFAINMASLEANTISQINSAPRDNSSPLMGAIAPMSKAASDGKFDEYLA